MEEKKEDLNNYEEGIEELDEMDDLLKHLRMGNNKEGKNSKKSQNLKKSEKSKNSQMFSEFLKDIEDVYIDRESSPINQIEFALLPFLFPTCFYTNRLY